MYGGELVCRAIGALYLALTVRLKRAFAHWSECRTVGRIRDLLVIKQLTWERPNGWWGHGKTQPRYGSDMHASYHGSTQHVVLVNGLKGGI